MKNIPFLSLGFGKIGGLIQQFSTSKLTKKERPLILYLDTIPSNIELALIKESNKNHCLIIPRISIYSHLASDIWASGIMTAVVENTDSMVENQQILIDFNSDILRIAESQFDKDQLDYQSEIVDHISKFRIPSQNHIRVISEVKNTSDIIDSANYGANDISVVKADVFLKNGEVNKEYIFQFLSVLKDYGFSKKLKLRFFDFETTPSHGDPFQSLETSSHYS